MSAAVEDLAAGRMTVIVGGEADMSAAMLVLAADLADARAMNFMSRQAGGVVCLALGPEQCARLALAPMTRRNESALQFEFTVSIEARVGVTTGISAADRARTIRAAIGAEAGPADVVSPGHVFPIRTRPGGVLEHAGLAEGAVDLVARAGRVRAAVLCGLLRDDGAMAVGHDLARYCAGHGFSAVTVDQVVAYRRRRAWARPRTAPGAGCANLRATPQGRVRVTGCGRRRDDLRIVLLLLFVSGWAANQFVSVIPVLRHAEHLSSAVLDGAFCIYAVGLIPGLLGGGRLSDQSGRRPVVLRGASVAATGNLLMLADHSAVGILAGRCVVGVGVGLAVSAGTAWAADLGGRAATTQSGVILTCGFASGPIASSLIAQIVPTSAALRIPFATTGMLSLTAVGLATALRVGRAPVISGAGALPISTASGSRQRPAIALAASVPMALWVFSTVNVAFVVLAGRMAPRYPGAWLPGAAVAVSLGAGLVIQVLARRARWGARAGVSGAACAALGFSLAAAAGPVPTLTVFLLCAGVLGCAYGLCLREGLTDVETLAPPARRGTLIGIFYVVAYVGFGVPLLLIALQSSVGETAPMVGLALLAAATALTRAAHMRATTDLVR